MILLYGDEYCKMIKLVLKSSQTEMTPSRFDVYAEYCQLLADYHLE